MLSGLTLYALLDVMGTFVFGLTGAMVAVRRGFDLFGILVLSAAVGVAGGVVRDVLLGDVPPAVLVDLWPLALTCAAGLVAFFFAPVIERLDRPVMLLDAVGLGVFAIAGCNKALVFGLGGFGAVLLGVLTAIGGGVLRDIMTAQVPRVLHEEVYALAALAGAAAYALGLAAGLPGGLVATGAVLLAIVIRIASVRNGWTLPKARG
ncbi:trimeric intracellular cation channel family protein [Pseudooceanicola sp. C21-150M6]|uniref:trimeric intracellular cation channel family protein n=1 Tax=Pseudooceanicola sp. C21-150M6 TaxID=3434355 RepID=UPI003D7F2306